jgi:RHS repeat-associated protein
VTPAAGEVELNVSRLYTGRDYERETGDYYYRARYYNSSMATFLSPDPIGFAGGDTNFYRYVKNNATRFSDPLGLDRRRCSRRLNSLFTPFKIGKLRHDYVEFRDSKGQITRKSWGDKGMINESEIETSSRTCDKQWKKTSGKADQSAKEYADTLGETMDYAAESYNCQDFAEDVLKYQTGK